MPDLLSAAVRATAAATGADDLLDRVAQLLVPYADWVVVDRLDDPDLVTRVAAYDATGPLTLAQGRGPEPARRSSAGSVGLLPVLMAAPGRVLRLDHQELLAAAAGHEPHRSRQAGLALSLGATELVLVGLQVRDQLVGVLTLGSRTRVSDEMTGQLADLGLHVGLALDAARRLRVQREVATVLQTSLLPPVPAVPGLSLAARYLPATHGPEVGGDWYDVTLRAADVSGLVAAGATMLDHRADWAVMAAPEGKEFCAFAAPSRVGGGGPYGGAP